MSYYTHSLLNLPQKALKRFLVKDKHEVKRGRASEFGCELPSPIAHLLSDATPLYFSLILIQLVLYLLKSLIFFICNQKMIILLRKCSLCREKNLAPKWTKKMRFGFNRKSRQPVSQAEVEDIRLESHDSAYNSRQHVQETRDPDVNLLIIHPTKLMG